MKILTEEIKQEWHKDWVDYLNSLPVNETPPRIRFIKMITPNATFFDNKFECTIALYNATKNEGWEEFDVRISSDKFLAHKYYQGDIEEWFYEWKKKEPLVSFEDTLKVFDKDGNDFKYPKFIIQRMWDLVNKEQNAERN